MSILWPAGQTPYVTPDQLAANAWPVGVDFTSIPPGRTVSPDQKLSALAQICMSASTEADGHLNMPLRATAPTEMFHGPGDFRVNVQNGARTGRIVCQRGPILAVTNVQTAPNAVFPRQWTTLPSGYYEPEYPVMGMYGSQAPSGAGQGGQAVIIAPGYVNWCLGRYGYAIKVSYTAAWPHTSLTAAATKGATTVSVDDCTAWGPLVTGGNGTAGVVYDAAEGTQEAVTCTAASATTGPGTLTLAAGLAYAHAAGVMVSSLPTDAIWATVHFCAAMALARGATTTSIQTQPGRGGGGTGGAREHREHGRCLLDTFKRVI